ncbi:unnamed protein product [Adineta steineri]|uniref:N-acylglucosamine 2-epimerase n=1 Tax=Adineta steineri TaxID=433720 RepID=A0A819CRU7_9BILA|nr:unnamed protein product [Adineta steineri]CAF3820259.1 unnamed protein product [Adineta steineri]
MTESYDFTLWSHYYRDYLLSNIIPFWLRHSIDTEYGGYFTCLDRYGKVFDTDKFIWLQARQVWMFAKLYQDNDLNVSDNERKEWLKTAQHGAIFLEKYGRHPINGQWYFSLTQQGHPLIEPYNIFSSIFASMAFGQMAKIDKNNCEKYKQIALETFDDIQKRRLNPKGEWNKASDLSPRKLKSFALPMMMCNLSMELEHLIDKQLIQTLTQECIQEIIVEFRQADSGLILEYINANDGSRNDSFEGRLLNPGHGIEAMWFLLDIAERKNNKELTTICIDTIIKILEYSWDEKYNGIFYFLDIEQRPPQQLEWDQKLWWVHLETLIALIKAIDHQPERTNELLGWLNKVQKYTIDHFVDSEGGELYGYLNRQGEVLLNLKGGKWKGCYHVPRAFYLCYKTLDKISKKK